MPITSLLALTIKPESVDEAHAVISGVLEATRVFDGNHGVDVLVDENDPTHIVLSQSWESFAHDDAYRAWRATPEGASNLGSILAEPPTLVRYSVAEDV